MVRQRIASPVVVLAALSVLLIAAGGVSAASPESDFYQAYYQEIEQRDFAKAAELYTKVLGSRKLDPDLKRRAESRLAACKEELACDDLAELMPAEALVYVELNRPGDQLNRLLDMLGLLGERGKAAADQPGRRVAISPVLLEQLIGIRGAAFAMTGFDPQRGQPTGVGVLHPGDIELVRAAIESGLPIAASTVEPIAGFPVYNVEDEVLVCLTSRLVILGFDRDQIQGVVQRLQGGRTDSLASSPAMQDILSQRSDSIVFFFADAAKIYPMIAGMAGSHPDFQQARALMDLDNLKWVAGRAGVTNDGLMMDFVVRFNAGHHNLVYNLVRTPPITKETLKSIPNGAAGFLAGALADPGTRVVRTEPAQSGTTPSVTGLDIGRELFANIVDFVVFALPPETEGQKPTSPAPDIAAVIRVSDPSKSEVLWTQILGIMSLAAGAPTTDGTVQNIAGVEARLYNFPDNVSMYFATSGNQVLISTSTYAMSQAVSSARNGQSILDDEAFAASISSLDKDASKVMFVHPGRCFQMGKPFMHPSEIKEAEPFIGLMDHTVVSVVTHESEERLHAGASITGLPDVSRFVVQMIEMEEKKDHMRKQLRRLTREEKWDEAQGLMDEMIAGDPGNSGLLMKKFNLLAVDKKDHAAAAECAQVYVEKISGSATELNNFGWYLLTDDDYGHQYNDLALRCAQKACAMTDHGNWMFVDTLARAKFDAGDVNSAIEMQKKAIELYGKDDNEEMNETLERYEKAQDMATAKSP